MVLVCRSPKQVLNFLSFEYSNLLIYSLFYLRHNYSKALLNEGYNLQQQPPKILRYFGEKKDYNQGKSILFKVNIITFSPSYCYFVGFFGFEKSLLKIFILFYIIIVKIKIIICLKKFM